MDMDVDMELEVDVDVDMDMAEHQRAPCGSVRYATLASRRMKKSRF